MKPSPMFDPDTLHHHQCRILAGIRRDLIASFGLLLPPRHQQVIPIRTETDERACRRMVREWRRDQKRRVS